MYHRDRMSAAEQHPVQPHPCETRKQSNRASSVGILEIRTTCWKHQVLAAYKNDKGVDGSLSQSAKVWHVCVTLAGGYPRAEGGIYYEVGAIKKHGTPGGYHSKGRKAARDDRMLRWEYTMRKIPPTTTDVHVSCHK